MAQRSASQEQMCDRFYTIYSIPSSLQIRNDFTKKLLRHMVQI